MRQNGHLLVGRTFLKQSPHTMLLHSWQGMKTRLGSKQIEQSALCDSVSTIITFLRMTFLRRRLTSLALLMVSIT
jgi:hypothetical protein